MALQKQVGMHIYHTKLMINWAFRPQTQNIRQLFLAAPNKRGTLSSPLAKFKIIRAPAIFSHASKVNNDHHRYMSTSSTHWTKYPTIKNIDSDDVDSTPSLSAYEAESSMYPSWEKYSGVEIANAKVSTTGEMLIVSWRDDEGGRVQSSTSYPLVWLRDNCRCSKCFSPQAMARKASMRDLDLDGGIENLVKNDKYIQVTWTDGHRSQYPARWLRCNAFSDSDSDPAADLEPRLWDAPTCRDRIRAFEFDDLLNDDRALFEFLREVRVLGITIVANTPQRTGQLNKLGERVGYLTRSNYGETFHVHSRLNPQNVAYTSNYLPIHTDLSYLQHPPGIQLLHCIKQTDGEGGENMLVDGFKVAHDLREKSPDLYDLLTTEVVEYFDIGADFETGVGEFFQHSRHRVIRLDHRKQVDRIVFSDHGRASMLRLRVDDVIPLYRALTAFAALLYDPANVYEYKLRDGDILIMDNHRVMHGRQAYTMQPGSERHLEGSYFDWDTAMSRLRVLQGAAL